MGKLDFFLKIRILVFATLLLSCRQSSAQHHDEKVLNQVARQLVKPEATLIYLLEGWDTTEFYQPDTPYSIQTYMMYYLTNEFKDLLVPEIMKEISSNAFIDTIAGTWNFSLLDQKWINVDSLKKSLERDFHPHIDSTWTEQQKIDSIGRQITQLQIAQESYQEWRLGRPVFDRKRNYCVISCGYFCGMLCGNGFIALFKKTKGKWVLLRKVRTWVS